MNRLFFLLLLSATLPACQQAPAHFEHHEVIAGIEHTLWIEGADRKAAQRASEAVFSELRLLSSFTQPVNSKPMARTNLLLRSGEWFSVNPSITGILKSSIKYYNMTNGIFNPAALGTLREAWGIYADPDMPKSPNENDLQTLLSSLPTMDDIQFDAIRLRGNNKHIRLDFDYLSYGYAIDTEIQHLQDMGIQNARLKISGADRIIGTIPGTGDRAAPATCDRAIPTHTDAKNPIPAEGILNLKTGQPLENVSGIRVVADNASDATVACWALLVSDSSEWPQLVKRLHVASATLLDAKGAAHSIAK